MYPKSVKPKYRKNRIMSRASDDYISLEYFCFVDFPYSNYIYVNYDLIYTNIAFMKRIYVYIQLERESYSDNESATITCRTKNTIWDPTFIFKLFTLNITCGLKQNILILFNIFFFTF